VVLKPSRLHSVVALTALYLRRDGAYSVISLDIPIEPGQRGLVRAKWDVTENNRKARFYTITAAGRRQLATEKAEWERMTSIMQALLLSER